MGRSSSISALVVFAGGCGRLAFDPGAPLADTGHRDVHADARVRGPACPNDPSLLACWDFDGDLGDRTGRGNDPIGSDVAFVVGIEGGALEMSATSRADLATPNLATVNLTVEAWVRSTPRVPTQLVFDHQSRWVASITEQGELRCGGAGGVPTVLGSYVATGTWVHFACSFGDGAYRAYVDGEESGVTVTSTTLVASNTVAAIGGDAPAGTGDAPFVGAVDRFGSGAACSPAPRCARPQPAPRDDQAGRAQAGERCRRRRSPADQIVAGRVAVCAV